MSHRLDDRSNLSKEWLRDRLEDAVRTHDLLPPALRLQVRTMYDGINVHVPADSGDETQDHVTHSVTAADVRRLNEVLEWMRQIPGEAATKRLRCKVLFLRSRLKGDQPTSWRRIAEMTGVSYVKASYVYDRALFEVYGIVEREK